MQLKDYGRYRNTFLSSIIGGILGRYSKAKEVKGVVGFVLGFFGALSFNILTVVVFQPGFVWIIIPTFLGPWVFNFIWNKIRSSKKKS